jgi:hypothetical protein
VGAPEDEVIGAGANGVPPLGGTVVRVVPGVGLAEDFQLTGGTDLNHHRHLLAEVTREGIGGLRGLEVEVEEGGGYGYRYDQGG